jgi:diaminopimelate decarboxylase
MHDFKYKNSELYAENVLVRKIAEQVGTPLYIYSHNTFIKHLNAYRQAFNGQPHIICFALKANSNSAVLRILAKNGTGADVVSGGELYLALKAGIPPAKIVYAGVGKTEKEIMQALRARILMFNIESSDELQAIDSIAGSLRKKAPIALRVNPDIDPKTHKYIATGLRQSKFGIPIEDAIDHYKLAKELTNIQIVGIHKHIGSQITTVRPFIEALKKVIRLARSLRPLGISIKHLDIGGGLGIPYGNERPPHPSELSKAILPLLKKESFNLILEPGLLRPSLYDAFHNILPVKKNSRKKVLADIVGPICESGDFLAKNRNVGRLYQDDLLAVMSAGAYGFSMSSNYNSRPRAAEVLVKGSKFFIVREREKYQNLISGTNIPDFLK